MIVRPAQALTLLSRFQPMAPGDLLLTGTPGGTALKAPAKLAGMLAGLLPPATRWKLFFKRQAANPRYLHDGDVITATIASPDGQLDLGTQHNTDHREDAMTTREQYCRCRSRPTSCCWTPPAPGQTASPRSGSRTRAITPAAWTGPTPSWRAR